MTPKQQAMLKDAKKIGSILYRNDEEMDELLDKGYLYDRGVGICEITTAGRRALEELEISP